MSGLEKIPAIPVMFGYLSLGMAVGLSMVAMIVENTKVKQK